MDNETPALSPSIAHTLITESPEHAWLRHRLLGGIVKEPTPAMQKGTLFHNLILEHGSLVEMIDADSFRTKAAKEHRDEILSEGKIPVLAEKLEGYMEGAVILRQRIEDFGYDLTDGTAELKVEWMESSESGDVLCHGILDWISEDRSKVFDLKTTDGSCHEDVCAMKLVKEGGAIQETAYRRYVEYVEPALVGRVDPEFLFCQTVPPWAVTPGPCAASMREIGESQWARAIHVFGRCLKAGREQEHWPSYVDRPVSFEAPGWAVAREIGEEW